MTTNNPIFYCGACEANTNHIVYSDIKECTVCDTQNEIYESDDSELMAFALVNNEIQYELTGELIIEIANHETISAVKLGSGVCCSVYLNRLDGMAYVFCPESSLDKSKNVMAEVYERANDSEREYLPEITYLGLHQVWCDANENEVNGYHHVFTMPEYEPLTATSKTAWKQATALCKLWAVWSGKHWDMSYPCETSVQFVEWLEDNAEALAKHGIDEVLVTVIDDIVSYSVNWYSGSGTLDLHINNFMVDSEGCLKLTDPIFNNEQNKRRV